MGLLSDFREFLEENKVISVAIFVIIGIASEPFTKSLMDNIITPIATLFIPGGTWRTATFQLGTATLGWGVCLQNLIMLLIISFLVFIGITIVNKLKKMDIVGNLLLGLLTLLVAQIFGIKVAITWLTVIFCALGGVEGAIIIALWSYLR
ncbi:MAG: MscL family protein [Methanosarcina vacuolata]|nr:MscL family protein [Methanosarcina vacuolata]